jgi:hypothetical protein
VRSLTDQVNALRIDDPRFRFRALNDQEKAAVRRFLQDPQSEKLQPGEKSVLQGMIK